MNVIFTDIDGVLNLNLSHTTNWNPTSIEIYNRICKEFDLKPVISSTWRVKNSIKDYKEYLTIGELRQKYMMLLLFYTANQEVLRLKLGSVKIGVISGLL